MEIFLSRYVSALCFAHYLNLPWLIMLQDLICNVIELGRGMKGPEGNGNWNMRICSRFPEVTDRIQPPEVKHPEPTK